MNNKANERKKEMKTQKKLISVIEASSIFGIGRNTLYHLAKTDPTLPTVKIGKKLRINSDLMDAWIDKATKDGRAL